MNEWKYFTLLMVWRAARLPLAKNMMFMMVVKWSMKGFPIYGFSDEGESELKAGKAYSAKNVKYFYKINTRLRLFHFKWQIKIETFSIKFYEDRTNS